MRKKTKEDEQTLADLSSAHHRSQAKCTASTKQLHKTSFLVGDVINILLSMLSQSAWKNPALIWSLCIDLTVLKTLIKILPCRPPAWLIRAKFKLWPYKDNKIIHNRLNPVYVDTRRTNVNTKYLNLVGVHITMPDFS